VKKLISIGVALALLTMAVVPGAVAAQDEIVPTTFAKIPFAIIGSGIQLVGNLVEALPMIAEQLPEGLDIKAATDLIAPWTAGPLAWTVDMLAWGVGLVGTVLGPVLDEFAPDFAWATALFDDIACGLCQPWSDNITGSEFLPCG
jgi:hypothetical protein